MMAELIDGKPSNLKPENLATWEKKVFERFRNKCANCGGVDHLRPKMIVPLEAGGQIVEENSILLCRPCEMASESMPKKSGSSERIVNVLVSAELHERLYENIKTSGGFGSVSSMVRYLISKYITDESRFEDLEMYQDYGSDVKMNIWVDKEKYAVFKTLVDRRGMTVTDALKGLLKMYEAEAEPLIRKKD